MSKSILVFDLSNLPFKGFDPPPLVNHLKLWQHLKVELKI